MTSLVVTANRSAAHDLLISGDSDGYLRLFRYGMEAGRCEGVTLPHDLRDRYRYSNVARPGPVRCCRYPCLSAKAEYNEEKVYSLQVACARFLFNDRHIVTVGGTDATLMLWDVVDD